MSPIFLRETATAIANAAGLQTFNEVFTDPTLNAERNLEGRTHYVDADTRRFFGSRVLSADVEFGGAVFVIVESVKAEWGAANREFRFVAFDISGTVINDRMSTGAARRSRKAADKDRREWLASFEPVAYYRGWLDRRTVAAEKSIEAMRAVARVIA